MISIKEAAVWMLLLLVVGQGEAASSSQAAQFWGGDCKLDSDCLGLYLSSARLELSVCQNSILHRRSANQGYFDMLFV